MPPRLKPAPNAASGAPMISPARRGLHHLTQISPSHSIPEFQDTRSFPPGSLIHPHLTTLLKGKRKRGETETLVVGLTCTSLTPPWPPWMPSGGSRSGTGRPSPARPAGPKVCEVPHAPGYAPYTFRRLKCSRGSPCDVCVRRGLSSLCSYAANEEPVYQLPAWLGRESGPRREYFRRCRVSPCAICFFLGTLTRGSWSWLRWEGLISNRVCR